MNKAAVTHPLMIQDLAEFTKRPKLVDYADALAAKERSSGAMKNETHSLSGVRPLGTGRPIGQMVPQGWRTPDHLRVPASVTRRKRSTSCLYRGAANARNRRNFPVRPWVRRRSAHHPDPAARTWPPLTSGLRIIPAVSKSRNRAARVDPKLPFKSEVPRR
jgi:hypothetical protein